MGKNRYRLRRVADRPCIQVRWSDSDKWVSTGCRTMEEAKAWADAIVGSKGSSLMFKDYAQDFFIRTDKDSKRIRDRMDNRENREGTYYNDQRFLDLYLMPFFGRIGIASITPKVVDEWKKWMRFEAKRKDGSTGYSIGTINQSLYALSLVLDSAVYDEILVSNPVMAVKKLGGSSKPKPIWSEEELAMLFPNDESSLVEIWNGRPYAMLAYTLYNTGFRPSEGCALKRCNIYPEMKGIHTAEVIDWHTKEPVGRIKTSNKGMKYKVSIVSDEFMDALSRYIETLPPEQEYLFLKDNGDFISSNNLYQRMITACSKAKVTFHGPYTLRHNFITRTLDELDDRAALELAGHTTYEVCYDHRTPEMIIRKAKAMIDRARMLNQSSSTSENGSPV